MKLEDYPKQVKDINIRSWQIYNRLSDAARAGITREDLVQSGMLALVEMVRKSDITGRPIIPTYSRMRVKGAMMDCVRKASHVTYKQLRRINVVITHEPVDEYSMGSTEIDIDILDLDTILDNIEDPRCRIILEDELKQRTLQNSADRIEHCVQEVSMLKARIKAELVEQYKDV